MNDTQQHSGIKFSVIIPVYNGSKTIRRAIASVLSQSYDGYEIIVVDDNSTDDTCAIVQDTYDAKVRLVQRKENGGSAAARNEGMEAATGNYIAFLDADDAWHHDKLMLMKIALAANPHIHLVYHPYTLQDITTTQLPDRLTVYRVPFARLLVRNPISTSCLVIKNDPAFRFDASMRYTEDHDLCLRIGYKHKIFLIDIVLTQLFRPVRSEGGVSAKKWEMRKGEMRAYMHLTKLNLFFILLLPFLLLYSMGKHIYKMVTGS